MPSIGTFKAQPVTRCFVCTQESGDHWGTYYFNASAIESWFNGNTDTVTKVSEGLYIVASSANFYDVMQDLNSNGRYTARKTLIDFGKDVIIGNEVNSRLLVLRRVQVFGEASVGGDGSEAYVVVENNTTDLAPYDAGRFTVRVARI